jgi:adenine-specific DNA glycosylase
VPPLEWGFHLLQEYDSLRMMDEPKENSSSEAIPATEPYKARELNPEYPGVFDLAAFEIGRAWCKARMPLCELCYMNPCCPTAKRQLRPS